jgi:hypothetical protein
VQRILQSADENQPPYRPIERAAPDVHRRVAAEGSAASRSIVQNYIEQ